MALFKFMRTPTPQKFSYKPRFYDPDKEDLQERLEQAMQKKEQDPEAVKRRIATGFKHRGGYNPSAQDSRSRGVKQSNFILIGIIIVLLFMTYFFLELYLPQIENFLK